MSQIPTLHAAFMQANYALGSDRVFFCDWDGTLTPIVEDPAAAVPTERLMKILESLAQNQKNVVWIVSGRDRNFLEKHFGHIKGMGLSAEHGCFMRLPGTTTWDNQAEKFNMDWQEPAMDAFRKFTELAPGSVIERKSVAITWHYRNAEPKGLEAVVQQCKEYVEKHIISVHDVHVLAGKMVLEIRPNAISKGNVVTRLMNLYKADFVFCAGDDTTDEDMFAALKQFSNLKDQVCTVSVGPSEKKTLANFTVRESGDVVALLGLLVDI